jgi:hypothetical protein
MFPPHEKCSFLLFKNETSQKDYLQCARRCHRSDKFSKLFVNLVFEPESSKYCAYKCVCVGICSEIYMKEIGLWGKVETGVVVEL